MADAKKETAEARPDRAILSLEMRLGLLAVLIAIAVIATQGEPSGTRRIAILGSVILGIMLDPGRGVRRARENAEAVIVAIVLALVIRHYSLEAFEIPTGSMAPGLNGVHIDATCPNCGTVDSVGISTDQETNRPDKLRLEQGYLYRGPCPQCATPIEDATLQEGAPVHCRKCDTTVIGDAAHYERTTYSSVWVRCHECTLRYEDFFEVGELLPGHKILVNKAAYEVAEPERWDVIVFKFNRQRNYIKRLVGLPGERIEVQHGDIAIDGKIERKPLHVQEEMWFPVHDSEAIERGIIEEPWATDARGGFKTDPEDPGVKQFNALDGLASLRYRRKIENHYAYNGAKYTSPDVEPIRDFRARTEVRVNAVDRQKGPRYEIDLRNGEVIYRLSLPFGDAKGEVRRLPRRLGNESNLPESERAGPDGPHDGWSVFAELPEGSALELQRRYEIEFSLADRQLRVLIDGELLLEMETDIRDRDTGFGPLPDDRAAIEYGSITGNDITIRARNCGGRLDRVRIDRDIHYTNEIGSSYKHAVRGPYTIGDEHYFAMGDNSPSSLDSRAWGALHRDNLLGRGFAIFWPAIPWGRWEVGFIE